MASKNISFDTIPSGIRKPGKYFEYNTKLAVRTLPANDQTVLIIGQRTADGTVPALKPVDVFSGDQAALYFGAGSLAHIAAVAAITAYKYVSLTVIAVDDAVAGQPAKGTVEFTGPATADGAFALFIGNTRVDIAVYAADTEAAIATRLKDQIAQKTALPITADSVNGKVTLTAKNKGAFGNDIALSQLNQAPGINATITALSGGLNDPDIAPALAAVYGAKYNLYATCWPTTESLTKLRTHLDSISGALEQRPAIGVAGTPATLSTATTLAGDLNAGRITIGWHPGSVCLPAEIAAAYAAVISSETDPARPLNTLALTGLDVTPIPSQPGRTEQEKALHNGVTPFEIGPGNVVQIVRSITMYTKDAQGIDDPALLDITTIRSLDYVRKACQQRIALRFPREKLSNKTPPKVRSELLDVLTKCEELEITENVEANKDNLIIERDLQDENQLDGAIPCDVVNGLHVFAGRIDLIL
ncbi:TPA: phage tail sheath subtilisin-like domain-containing protein [Burkholderia vietnamiensis]|uniref:phage tail sheath subtilisin-like domain-containing protein n=1 Tax=Burkholderia vietnamiensis TaxID=60552 RepID=UPI0015931760|nr:phage tail sheath subtilisin-like domain-containing protein [Burkholderia vietnamiensis]MBR7910098.1 phage tail sheath subtilisin-like domain-containing protein [Burkholderia vietnamiensis]HDR9101730.1 phage tail sheath subtilisin-like domain-containing protein [Burkholderia vietnamiensis]HDR9274162.1 phage tail sheath subtilisin-like domain-containing protein [Burkholderia vietnamiensis]